MLSQASVFIKSSRGKWAAPPLLWSFPPKSAFTIFPVPDCWVGVTTLAFTGGLVYLTSMRDCPSPPLGSSVHTALFVTCLFCYCLLFSFSFFPWVGVGVSRGLCWSGPGLSVGVPCVWEDADLKVRENILFLIAFTKNCLKLFLFCHDNCQKFLVLQVNPRIFQVNKNLLKHREVRGNWAHGMLLH
jgi:hypothetical protein